MSNVQSINKKTMRDAFLEQILAALDAKENIYFVTADFGAPVLDKVRERHADRFINVGIAEQNLINVCCGLGLEGFTVYAYAIAPFLSMRCYEQIRLNLAVLSQLRPMNVNLISVGSGFSYDVSGPTHHCLEDLSIIRTLPNFKVISPSCHVAAASYFRYTADNVGVKYLRFDAKPHTELRPSLSQDDVNRGFVELRQGGDLCLLSTGFMTQRALVAAEKMVADGRKVGHIDMTLVKGFNETQLVQALKPYKRVITLEEGFIGKGGLDAAISTVVHKHDLNIRLKAIGLEDTYSFHIGGRDSLHAMYGMDVESILKAAN